MDLPNRIDAALSLQVRRIVDKTRDLKLDGKARDPVARIAALEKQLDALLQAQPAQLLTAVLAAVGEGAAPGAPPVALDPHHVDVLAAYDRLCKQLLGVSEQRLGKLPASAGPALASSRQRLKKTAREGRAQLEQRLERHSATVRKAGAERRDAVRAAVAAGLRAEQAARRRARALWIGALSVLLGTALILWLRR